MKSKWLILVAVALLLISAVAVKPALAFFTDTSLVKGSVEIKLGDGKLIPMEDTVTDMIKKVAITNTGEYEVFVRAKAIYPESCTVTYQPSEGWSLAEDGYYYYSEIVYPGEKTPQLLLKVETDLEEGEFNVIIVQEATRVIYDEDGNASGNWEAAIQAVTTEEFR